MTHAEQESYMTTETHQSVESVSQHEVLDAIHDLGNRLSNVEQRFQRTASEAQREGRRLEHAQADTSRVVMRERPQRTRGGKTSEFAVTAALMLGLLVFAGYMAWLWVHYPQADWAMLLNLVVAPAAAWVAKTYVAGRGAEKVERIRQGEPV